MLTTKRCLIVVADGETVCHCPLAYLDEQVVEAGDFVLLAYYIKVYLKTLPGRKVDAEITTCEMIDHRHTRLSTAMTLDKLSKAGMR